MKAPRIPEIPHWLPGGIVGATIIAGLFVQVLGYSWMAL
jgi:hypothetical protein